MIKIQDTYLKSEFALKKNLYLTIIEVKNVYMSLADMFMKVNIMSMSSDSISLSCSTNTFPFCTSMKKHFSCLSCMCFVRTKWKTETKEELSV
jgi:hypothetical protein